MFDCGSSRIRSSRKEKTRDCNASVVSSVSGSYRSVKSKHEPSRRCIESDAICDLIDSLRYSGRSNFSDDRRNNRITEYIDDRRRSGYRSSECLRNSKHDPKVCADILKFDGGSSTSEYVSGPIFDFGSSTANPPEPSASLPSNQLLVQCNNNEVPPGNHDICSRSRH
jgi:hypothetical protein